MIMKANKQIGFIYKDNESIDKILKDGDVVFERGFLREKTSTTLPITFGGVGKNLKDYRVYGNTKQQLLPNGYTQVDYIKTTGAQHIDTGVYGNLNTLLEIKASRTTLDNNNKQLAGSLGNTYSITINIGPSNLTRFGTKSYSMRAHDYITADKPSIFICNKNGITIDGNSTGNFNEDTNFTTESTLYLMGANNSSTKFPGKLYYAKIYDNNVLIRYFIPCYRNSDNEVGLYDLVNNVFYINQGTGVFTYGSVAPTPDAPIEIVSCGDRTKNLYYGTSNSYTFTNSDTATWYFINGVRQAYGTTIGNKTFYKAKVEENKTYTLKAKLFGATLTNQLVYENENIVASISKTELENGITFTSDRNGYVILRLRVDTDVTISISDIQLEEGSTATEYEPYGKYKIPVNVRSDNLATNFDNGWYNGPNQIFTNANNFKRCIAKIKPNTTYTISKKNASNRFVVITSEFEIAPNVQYKRLVIAEFNTNRKVLSFTTQDDENYLFFGYYNGTDETEIELAEAETMIVEGSTTPDKYIPYYNETTNIYLDEPLRKRVDYSDYIDFINGKVVRNIKEYIFNGSNDDNYVFNSDNTNTLGINILPNKIDSPALKPMSYIGAPIICNKFNYLNDITDKEHIYSSNGTQIDETKRISNIRLYLNKSRLEGYSSSMTNTQKIELLKTWLSSNNITVDYILLTPTQETITLPNIPTIEENNTLNIEAEITPSQVYIKYKSNN